MEYRVYPYKAEPVPGTFDHKGLDCAVHGENVPHARPIKTQGPFLCVRCMLIECQKLASVQRLAEEQAAAEEKARTVKALAMASKRIRKNTR